nr:hypothetical protein [Tanacetum cinerariifolium]
PGVPDVPTEEFDEEIFWKSSDKEDDDNVDEGINDQDDDDDNQDNDDQDERDDDDDQDEGNDDDQDSNKEGEEFIHLKLSIHDEEETKEEESFDPIPKTLENSDDEGNDDDNLGMNISSGEGQDAEDDEDELYRDVNINMERRVAQMADVHTTQEFEDTHVTLTPFNPDVQQQMASLTLSAPTLTPSTIATISTVPQAPNPPIIAPSTLFQYLPNFGSLFGFDHRLKTLEANFSEFMQTNQFAGAVSSIPRIVQRYTDQQINEAVKTSGKSRLRDEAQAENEEFSRILMRIFKRSLRSKSKSRNLYKALVEAYEFDKIILDTYGDIVTLKRHRDDNADKDKQPFAGSDQGSKRRREGKEPESTNAPREKATRTTGRSTQGSKPQQKTASESAPAEEQIQTTQDLEEPSHQEFETGAANDQPIAEASQHPEWFQQQKKPPTLDHTLTPELLAGPTYELLKGSCKSLVELEFFLEEVYKATIDQLDWNNPEGQQYPHNLLKSLPGIPNSRGHRVISFGHFINKDLEYLRREPVSYDKHALWGISYWGRKRQRFYEFDVNKESARDVYSKHKIIAVIELQIVEWHNYKHSDWITARRDDDKLYKFKEGDFKRLRIQDIKDMLLLPVQGKLTNLTVEECFAFNVSLRMFTRSIVIQRRMEDLQLGVESYQKKLNLTKPDSYHSDLKRKEAYTAYSNPRGFIYQNKDNQNRLMRIDELHKFSDGTLNDVRTALDDCLKGVRMKYLPQITWRKSDKERAASII